jgi:hypothetical protein
VSTANRLFEAYQHLKSLDRVANQEEFGGFIGENKSGVTDIKSGRKQVSLNHLALLEQHAPEINISYIVTGKGSLNISDESVGHVVEETRTDYGQMPRVITVDAQGNENIVLVPVKAAAGYLNGYGDPKFIGKLPTYRMPNLNHGTFRMFQTKGTSMLPTIHDSAYVVGQFVENWEKGVKDDRVYVVVSRNDGIVIKRCLNRIKKYGHIYAKSDNRREFPNMTIEVEDILEIWEYKMHLAFELPNPADLYERLNDLESRLNFLERKILKTTPNN